LIDWRVGKPTFRTCAAASWNVSLTSEGYTVFGLFYILRHALRPLAETNNKDDEEDAPRYCSLRVNNPSPDTLGRFVNACQRCRDFPNTMGLAAPTHLYFCKKTVRD
jgi:hypothetical protein